MKTTFKSKSSKTVRIATIGISAVIILLILSSITINTLAGSIAALLGLSILLFFYATSLKEVILTEDYLILKKHLNPIHIPYKKILSVKKLKYANLTMTSGSKGFLDSLALQWTILFRL